MNDESEDTATMLPDTKARKYRTRWFHLADSRSTVDYEMAVFAHDLRYEFPKGPSGDFQFRAWLREQLFLSGARIMLLRSATEAIDNGMRDVAVWRALGGWSSVSFLMGLTKPERAKVLRASLARVEQLGHSICLSTVRKIAFDLDIVTKRPGRPSRSESELRNVVLAKFIAELYETMDGLPDIPAEVRRAMKSGPATYTFPTDSTWQGAHA